MNADSTAPSLASAKLRALFSLFPPLRSDSDASNAFYDRFIEDFRTPKAVTIRGSFTHNGEWLKVIARPCLVEEKERYFANVPFLHPGDQILELAATFKFPGQDRFYITDPAGNRIGQTEEAAVELWRSHLPHDLDLTIQSYFCALAIAYAGVIRPTRSVWVVDNAQDSTDRYYLSQIHDSIEFLRERRAMPDFDLEFEDVIRWTFAQNGMFDGYSDTPASRALNYFTRLFVSTFRNDELSDLVWAFAGIEALLVEGGRSSIGQLREKLIALFGDSIDQRWLTKMIASSYDFRSRMVHGNRQIRSFFRRNEDEAGKRSDEEYESERFTIGILVLLLRFIIAKDHLKLRFRTVLSD